MGYFSNLAIEFDERRECGSYPSPVGQLLWRLEDLQNRLELLKEAGAPYRGKDVGLGLTENDIRYAIPEYFECITDVERAIGVAKSDLYAKYGVGALDDARSTCRISLFGWPLAGPYNAPQKAA